MERDVTPALDYRNAEELKGKAAEAAALLAALANPHRLAILCQLVAGECSVGTLVDDVGLSQSALSQHLAKLRGAGIVATRRDAQTIYYSIASAAAGSVMATLARIYCKPRTARSGGSNPSNTKRTV
jgi:DNA-binding transcriptional ArsR family regulator